MKHFSIAILFIGMAALTSTAHATPPLYPLTCNMGGDTRFLLGNIRASHSGHIRALPEGVYYQFNKASSAQNILPGECSWADRPMYLDEPSNIYFGIDLNGRIAIEVTPGVASSHFNFSPPSSAFNFPNVIPNTSGTPDFGVLHSFTLPPYAGEGVEILELRFLLENWRKADTFHTFWVYNYTYDVSDPYWNSLRLR